MKFLHIRFNPPIKDKVLGWLSEKSPRYIVSEEGVDKGVSPLSTAPNLHYHACFETTVVEDTVKGKMQQFCKELGLNSSRGRSNAYYGGVKECTDASYVCKGGNIVASFGYMQVTIEELIKEGKQKYLKPSLEVPIVAVSPTNTSVTVIPQRKARTSEEKIIAFVIRHYNWELNQHWTISKVESLAGGNDEPWYRYSMECSKVASHYLKCKLNHPQHVAITRNVMYLFGDDDVRELLVQRLAAIIYSSKIV